MVLKNNKYLIIVILIVLLLLFILVDSITKNIETFKNFNNDPVIYVINMEKDKDRLNKITKNFKKANLSFKRVDAVDGKKLTEKEKMIANRALHTIETRTNTSGTIKNLEGTNAQKYQQLHQIYTNSLDEMTRHFQWNLQQY